MITKYFSPPEGPKRKNRRNTDPWRKVLRVKFLYEQKAQGFAVACSLYRHYLECGHEQDRTTSRAHVKKVRCYLC